MKGYITALTHFKKGCLFLLNKILSMRYESKNASIKGVSLTLKFNSF